MVAPLIAGLAGLAGLAAGAIASVLGKSKQLFVVARLVGREVAGKSFDSIEEAQKWQQELRLVNEASILLKKVEHDNGRIQLVAISAVDAVGRRITPAERHADRMIHANNAADRAREVAFRSRQVDPRGFRNKLKSMGDDRHFDALEEQEKVSLLTTRFPTPEWARQANEGPYPDEYLKADKALPEILPLFDDTTSSHEWETSVRTVETPGKYFPGRQGKPSQPDELVVNQALQYPMDDLNPEG